MTYKRNIFIWLLSLISDNNNCSMFTNIWLVILSMNEEKENFEHFCLAHEYWDHYSFAIMDNEEKIISNINTKFQCQYLLNHFIFIYRSICRNL